MGEVTLIKCTGGVYFLIVHAGYILNDNMFKISFNKFRSSIFQLPLDLEITLGNKFGPLASLLHTVFDHYVCLYLVLNLSCV